MSPESKVGFIDIKVASPEARFTPDNQAWLASYGVDPLWQNNQKLVDELSAVISIGSRRLDEPVNQTIVTNTEIMVAREQFFTFVGVPNDTLDSFRAENPTIIPLDTFIGSQRTLTELGLDAAKVINALPAAIGYAPESVRAKFDNLTELGLDAAKVINASPANIGLAPESVRAKMNFLNRSIYILGWKHTSQELVQTHPAILGYNIQKLRILRRIAAYHIAESSRTTDPKQVGSSMILPLEKYIIALSERSSEESEPLDISELSKNARKYRLDKTERRQKALAVAPHLGKIGVMYKRYRNQ